MNKTVSLTKRVNVEGIGTRYCPVVFAANGRVKADYVVVDGQQEFHKEGAYYLSWYVGKQLKRMSVGTDATTAGARQHRQESILAARANGVTVNDPTDTNSPLLVNVAADYLTEIEAQKKPATHKSYRNAMRLFLECCSKQTLAEITREDMLAFITFMRKRDSAPTRFTCGSVSCSHS